MFIHCSVFKIAIVMFYIGRIGKTAIDWITLRKDLVNLVHTKCNLLSVEMAVRYRLDDYENMSIYR